jgi:hypothetical protein
MRSDKRRRDRKTKGFSTKRADTLAADLDILLGDLCVRWGFCNRLSGGALLGSGEPLTAHAFANAVLVAEGFPRPELKLDWQRRLRRLFVDRYGGAVSAADYVPG